MTKVSISDSFDGGNIELSSIEDNNGKYLVHLRIKPDAYTVLEETEHSQYFCFRATVSGLTSPTTVSYVIENASEVSYPIAWNGATVCWTHNMADTESWKRKLDTTYQGGQLCWTHQHVRNGPVCFSYFPPFTYAQHLDLLSRASEYADVQSLGQSLQGREIEYITVGNGPMTCWITHRQHPGETMAEYFAEGLLNRLLGMNANGSVDGLVRDCLRLYTFFIVPCVCPDGAVLGHLRTNSCGANLNREWSSSNNYEAPTLDRSPEVYHILQKMDQTGVDAFVDVHGDEELPYNFLSGAEETKNWGPRLQALHGAFLAAYCRANSDMQQEFGYDPPPPGKDRGNSACSAVANRFNCLAVTLEMPYKDCVSNPDPEHGWTTSRSRMLGASVLDALAYIQPHLRASGEFWKESFTAEEAYVRPRHPDN